MSKKQTKNVPVQLEKVFAIAGISLVILGYIANIYSLTQNVRFLSNDPLIYTYYIRYVILLGGGFMIGYLLAKKPVNKLFSGAFYATLAIVLFTLIDLARLGVDTLFGGLPYPWGRTLFFGASIITLLILMLVAYIARSNKNHGSINTLLQWTLITSFIVYEMYKLISGAYYLTVGAATYDPVMPLGLTIANYFTVPLAIAIVSYLLLSGVRLRQSRLYYAVFIGALYSALTLILWEFRTDASHAATNIFGAAVTVTALALVGILLWRARKAAV